MRFLFKTHYRQDIKLFKHNGQRLWYGLLLAAVMLAPALLDSFYLGELAFVYIYAIAGVGLMLLVGYTGLVSLGHAAFLAIGAYANAYLLSRGWPLPLSLFTASMISAAAGAISRPSIMTSKPSDARCSTHKPPPPMPELVCSTTANTELTATAASNALPPFASISCQASVAR